LTNRTSSLKAHAHTLLTRLLARYASFMRALVTRNVDVFYAHMDVYPTYIHTYSPTHLISLRTTHSWFISSLIPFFFFLLVCFSTSIKRCSPSPGVKTRYAIVFF
jgi:hypothetical protein